MSADPKTIEAITVCKICKHGIALTGLSVPIVGEDPALRAGRYVAALHDHIKRRHPQQAAQIVGMRNWLEALLVIDCYETEDAVLQKGRELSRAVLHAQTQKNSMSDADLKEGLAHFGKTAQEIEALMPIAQHVRDFLEEKGQYQHPAVAKAMEQARQAAS
jgi:hypothetical protein